MVSCNKLRSGFENVGSVTGTFYPPVASPHDQSLQHYTNAQSSKTANYSMQSTVENNYNPVQCANRQQSMGIRGAAEGCSGNVSFALARVELLTRLGTFQPSMRFSVFYVLLPLVSRVIYRRWCKPSRPLIPGVSHRYQIGHHQEYQTDTAAGTGQQHSILGHMDPGMTAEDEQQQALQLEKYFKYSHPTSVAHTSLSSQNMLDSNHNYASDLRYYAPQQTQMDMSNSQCVVDDQSKDTRCSNVGMGHAMEQYHQGIDVAKYPEHSSQQQPQQQTQQSQNIEHSVKAEDDFSVILADVRKTCYSS